MQDPLPIRRQRIRSTRSARQRASGAASADGPGRSRAMERSADPGCKRVTNGLRSEVGMDTPSRQTYPSRPTPRGRKSQIRRARRGQLCTPLLACGIIPASFGDVNRDTRAGVDPENSQSIPGSQLGAGYRNLRWSIRAAAQPPRCSSEIRVFGLLCGWNHWLTGTRSECSSTRRPGRVDPRSDLLHTSCDRRAS